MEARTNNWEAFLKISKFTCTSNILERKFNLIPYKPFSQDVVTSLAVITVVFKVISKFVVSRLFKELDCTYSRCSKIASFCPRLQNILECFGGRIFLEKIFEKFLV